MDVGILDCDSGNLRSLAKAVERAGRDCNLDAKVHIIEAAEEISKMERILLPGVGAFAYTMDGLERRAGMRDALEDAVLARGKPFLGICVGMQILMQWGFEHGRRAGLGWLPGATHPLEPSDNLRVPHMGWNELHGVEGISHPVFDDLVEGERRHVYFAHSYHVCLEEPRHLLATSDYGATLTAAIGRDNILGLQFHPEKSQRAGLGILGKFLNWKP